MNSKKAKAIRKSCAELGLNYNLQKKVFKSLGKKEQETYLQDCALLVNDIKNQQAIDSFK